MEKGIILLILLLLCVCMYSNELTKSDWQHVFIPAGIYIAGAQGFQLMGMDREDSEYISLSLVLLANLGKEYYDYERGGVSSMKDLQLSITGIVTSYYVNKAIDRFIWRR